MTSPPPTDLPILYSFRRCPSATRARMAIGVSGQPVGLREVVLRDKPPSLLASSPKGTLPVLVLPDGTVIDESLDIMRWALDQADPDAWLRDPHLQTEMARWVADNDGGCKHHLDRYKYASRYDGADPSAHRAQAALFLGRLDEKLGVQRWLFGDTPSYADIAIGPFIRQFAGIGRSSTPRDLPATPRISNPSRFFTPSERRGPYPTRFTVGRPNPRLSYRLSSSRPPDLEQLSAGWASARPDEGRLASVDLERPGSPSPRRHA